MNESKEPSTDDPADYLLKQNDFLDCCLTVGDPDTEEVEKIAVVRCHLVAHSSVFREMLMNSNLADPDGSNTHIKDIRPEVFKLMLKHMYGGRLLELKTMAKVKVLELAICADKYNVRRLVVKAIKQMIPKDVNMVFIPLRFVAYVQTSSLLTQTVTKIVQEETDKIVQHKEFLNLDENCVEFITKQEKLNIEEVDLWRAILKWGKHQAEECNLTLQDLLKKPIAYIRFAAFSLEQIVKEVVPEQIFSPTEAQQLLTAVANRRVIDIPGLCMSQQKRGRLQEPIPIQWNADSRSSLSTWKPDIYSVIKPSDKSANLSSCRVRNTQYSYDVAVVSLDFRAKDFVDISRGTYDYKCDIEIVQADNGFTENSFLITSKGRIVCGEIVRIPLKSSSGEYCILKPTKSWKIFLKFSIPHPLFNIVQQSKPVSNYTRSDGCIEVRHDDKDFHILSINYKALTKA